MKVNELASFVMSLSFEDLEKLQETITYCKNRKFKIGSKVSFVRKKSGDRIYGIIDRINQKSIGITTEDDGGWKVSKSLLRLEV